MAAGAEPRRRADGGGHRLRVVADVPGMTLIHDPVEGIKKPVGVLPRHRGRRPDRGPGPARGGGEPGRHRAGGADPRRAGLRRPAGRGRTRRRPRTSSLDGCWPASTRSSPGCRSSTSRSRSRRAGAALRRPAMKLRIARLWKAGRDGRRRDRQPARSRGGQSYLSTSDFGEHRSGEDAVDADPPGRLPARRRRSTASMTGHGRRAPTRTDYVLENSAHHVAAPTAGGGVLPAHRRHLRLLATPATSWAPRRSAACSRCSRPTTRRPRPRPWPGCCATANGRMDVPNTLVGAGEVQVLEALTRPLRHGRRTARSSSQGSVLDEPQQVSAPEDPPDVLASTRENAVWWGLLGGGTLLLALVLRPVLARRRATVAERASAASLARRRVTPPSRPPMVGAPRSPRGLHRRRLLRQPRPRRLGLGHGHLGLRLRARAPPRPTSAWRCGPRRGGPAARGPAAGGQRLDVRRELLPRPLVRRLARRGWTNSAKQPVANRDLWEPFVELVVARGDVAFAWVKGHSGHVMNDFVDQLAVEACRRGPA